MHRGQTGNRYYSKHFIQVGRLHIYVNDTSEIMSIVPQQPTDYSE